MHFFSSCPHRFYRTSRLSAVSAIITENTQSSMYLLFATLICLCRTYLSVWSNPNLCEVYKRTTCVGNPVSWRGYSLLTAHCQIQIQCPCPPPTPHYRAFLDTAKSSFLELFSSPPYLLHYSPFSEPVF